jgi:hypothetical protein
MLTLPFDAFRSGGRGIRVTRAVAA